jgi:hypothetical protein
MFEIEVDEDLGHSQRIIFTIIGDVAKRQVLRAALLGLSDQCRVWGVDLLSLLTREERIRMAVRLTASDSKDCEWRNP